MLKTVRRTTMDAGLFIDSYLHSNGTNIQGHYWDRVNLNGLLKRLSNTSDHERVAIRNILRQYKPATILDAGCGPATEKTSYETNGIPVQYTGMDQSYQMLGIAKQRHDDGRFMRGSVQEIPAIDSSFDAVLLKHVLEHLPNYEQATSEACRVARNIVVIDFFHRLLPVDFDVTMKDERGFWNNWYSRAKFEKFISNLPIKSYSVIREDGTAGQTAEIYVIEKP